MFYPKKELKLERMGLEKAGRDVEALKEGSGPTFCFFRATVTGTKPRTSGALQIGVTSPHF